MEETFCADSVWADFMSLAGKNPDATFTKEKLRVLETVDSTNAALLRELSRFPRLVDDSNTLTDAGRLMHKTLLASAHQTSGRGRSGRVFYSPEKSGVYFSFVWIPKNEVLNPAMYTVSAAVGVSRAIEAVCEKESKIKWVNDIYVGEKKVCGILTEGFCRAESGKLEALVVGIGINLTMGFDDVSRKLIGKAGGIFSEDEKPAFDLRSKLLASSLHEIFSILDSGGNVVDEYRQKSMLKNQLVMVRPLAGESDEAYRARVIDISDDAGLLVKLDDGTEKILYSGEVTLH
ncbi:MAG: biotin--[acetyl-CoA-carboxylase] ligase [Treponema sp.]|nr:biotin--[acetyl-CoA-carboxylase] ligase [Treponema sp.]